MSKLKDGLKRWRKKWGHLGCEESTEDFFTILENLDREDDMVNMNIYKIYQTENSNYDTYDSAIVAAKTENDARTIHPDGANGPLEEDSWVDNPRFVHVKYLGKAEDGTKRGVILSSFNAG